MKEAQQPTSHISSLCVHSYSAMISTTTLSTMRISARFGQQWVEPIVVGMRMWKLLLMSRSATTSIMLMKVEMLRLLCFLCHLFLRFSYEVRYR